MKPIDHIKTFHDELTAWSVVARGHLVLLEEDQAERVEDLVRQPWVSTGQYDVIELRPAQVTGRRFVLRRPEPDHALSARD